MPKLQALLLLASTVAMAAAQAPNVTLHVGDPAPPLKIAKWAKGQPVAQLGNGNINVVEFWATWCGPCRQSIPHLTELAKKYAGKATFIGVDSFERVPDPATCYAKVQKFVDDFGEKMDYHVAIDGVDGTMGKTWMEAAGQDGIPTAFVVDRAGKIAWIGHPMMGLDEVVGKMIAGGFDAKAEADKQHKQNEDAQAAMSQQQKLIQPILAARAKHDYKAEVAAIDSASASLDPAVRQSLTAERFNALAQYDEGAAKAYAVQLANGSLQSVPEALNEIAWTMVEDKSPIKHPDLAFAVKIATRAYNLSHGDPMIADTLALALYRQHHVGEALALQKKAIDKATSTADMDPATLKEMKTRLALYQKQAQK